MADRFTFGTGLYHPFIDIEDGRWLRNAVLFWEEIQTIAPSGIRRPYRCEDSKILHAEGYLTPVRCDLQGHEIGPGKGGWKTNRIGLERLKKASRIYVTGNRSLQFQRRLSDFNVAPINDVWTDVGTGSFTADKMYVVQTNVKIVQRCLLMATDRGI